MTQLLVSVRNAIEAKAALAGGADIVDMKEPRRGSLGACDLREITAVIQEVDGGATVTAACGELVTVDPEFLRSLPPGVALAKLGLAGCGSGQGWTSAWLRAAAQCPPGVGRVAVAYADWEQCQAPHPELVVEHATRVGCSHFLVDTSSKVCPLLDLVSADELRGWLARAEQLQIRTVLAGSLRLEQVERVVTQFGPNVVAVRGAVCVGNRTGEVSQRLTRELKNAVTEADSIQQRRWREL